MSSSGETPLDSSRFAESRADTETVLLLSAAFLSLLPNPGALLTSKHLAYSLGSWLGDFHYSTAGRARVCVCVGGAEWGRKRGAGNAVARRALAGPAGFKQ